MTPQPQSAPESCQEKEWLRDQIRAVMNEIIALDSQQLNTIIRDDFLRWKAVEILVSRARARKDALLEEYQQHVTSHRC